MLDARFKTIISLILIINSLCVEGHHPRKCAAFNEYCQVHSDCCSNSCLTYLYRCTRNYGDIFPYTFFGESYPVVGTYDNVLQATFSNVGGFGGRPQMQQNMQNIPSYFYSQNAGRHYNYNKPLNYYRFLAKRDVETETPSVAENEMQTAAASNEARVVAADCKVAGDKCYTNDECCTKRCHGFLHQCVT